MVPIPGILQFSLFQQRRAAGVRPRLPQAAVGATWACWATRPSWAAHSPTWAAEEEGRTTTTSTTTAATIPRQGSRRTVRANWG